MKTNVLGVNFDAVTKSQALDKILKALNEKTKCFVVTPNPEIVMLARNDSRFMQIINTADLVVPDGVGIVWASKFNTVKLTERVAGYDLVQSLFSAICKTQTTVYLLGSTNEVVTMARENMLKKFVGLNIIGVHDGFSDDEVVLDELMRVKPDVLLVGLGAPKQEMWLHKYKDVLPAKVMIGVGGSFDVMSGKLQRAPIVFQKLGLEWLFRLFIQPKRLLRAFKLPAFVFAVLNKKT